MSNIEEVVPAPARSIDEPFLISIEDVFSISGGDTTVIGRVERGTIQKGDEVEIVGINEDTVKSICTNIAKLPDEGRTYEMIGVSLLSIKREEIEIGQVLAKPGSITAHNQFKSEIHILSPDEGGRSTPLSKDYRPQFRLRTADLSGTIEVPEGVDQMIPGSNITIVVILMKPVAMEEGLRFTFHEGGRTIGTGVVEEILN
jgi:elongation factor Tu